jgi:transcriptional regulator with GAF, ATPase, and Fis domain
METPPVDVRELAFAAVNMAFGSLGRVCMALDADFRVRHASKGIDGLLGPGAAIRLRGRSIDEVLGPELFGADGPLRQALVDGHKREGWRALLRDEDGEARLLSVSAARLEHDDSGVCDPSAVYLLVLRPADDDPGEPEGMVGGLGFVSRSRAMSRVMRLVESLQHSESSVLITGESGTGKEVLARATHLQSPRRDGRFVAVSAAALPDQLLESELFGHVRGAFTGAVRDRPGRFEMADSGTLFLDEVGDVPLHLQVKLLRVLQERTYERVGDNEQRHTQARIIAATHRDLRRAVAEGNFREDLYYRLRVFPIELPPLRERREDIEPIADLLLRRVGTRTGRALRFSPEALRHLLRYDWPGNVRELENALEFAATVCQGQTLQPEDLPDELVQRRATASAPPVAEPEPGPGPEASSPEPPSERATLEAVLSTHHWNREATARALGVSRSTLWRRMRAFGLE